MSFIVQSELMKHMQAADAMNAGQDFSAIQTSAGFAVFFTQDLDGKLHAVRETSDDKNNSLGWQRVDLTPANGATVTNFAIAQNPQTLNFDLAVAGIVNGKHTLWISQNNSADIFLTFKDGAIPWQEKPPPTDLAIAKLHIMNLFEGNKKVQMIYADVFRRPQEHSQLIDRYYINPTEQPYWFPRSLGADFFANSMRTCVGRPAGEVNAGVYTFGIINTSQQLTYQPSMLGRASGHSPNVTRFIAPANSYSIASAPAQDASSTNLFVAAQDGLYLFAPNNQHDGAVPVPIFHAKKTALSRMLFAGIRKMTARWMGDQIVLFLLNTKQQLLYTSCKRGEEGDPDKWKLPMSICSRVQNYTFFIDTEADKVSSRFGNVVFAQTTNRNLTMLNQNLSTGMWETSHILLPSTGVSKVFESTTFNSRVKLIDANHQIQPDTAVTIEALSYTTAIIEGVSYFLEPGVEVPLVTKADGTLSIIQDAVGLGVARFKLKTGSAGLTATIDPAEKAYAKLETARTKPGALAAQKKNQSGTDIPLIPLGPNRDALAQSMADNVQSMLDGRTFFLSENHQGTSRRRAVPSTSKRTSGLGHGRRDSWWEVDWGDLAQYVVDGFKEVVDGVESVVEEATNFAVETAENTWKAVADIGSEVYGAFIDGAEAVGEAVIGVLDNVKTTIDDVLDWLGFLFDWDDIKRTHKFVKKILSMYTANITSSIDNLITRVDSSIDDLTAKARRVLDPNDAWSYQKVSTTGQTATISTRLAQAQTQSASIDSPQANWGAQMMSEHATSVSSTKPPSDQASTTTFTDKLNTLVTSAPVHDTALNQKLGTFQDHIVSKFAEMAPWDIVRETVALCIDLVSDFGKTLINGLLGFVKLVLSNVFDALNTPLDIPILSYVYSTYIVPGSELTIMDVTALVLAIPATLVYKAAQGVAPFPDEDSGLFKIAHDARDWNAFKTAVQASKRSAAAGQRSDLTAAAVFVKIFNALGAAGSVAVTILTAFAKKISNWWGIKYFCAAGVGSFIGFVAPNIASLIYDPGTITNVLNDLITITAVAKSVLDFGLPVIKSPAWMGTIPAGQTLSNEKAWSEVVSPWADMIINGFWFLVLAVGFIASGRADNQGYDWMMFAANSAFDLGGVIAPLASDSIGGLWGTPPGPTLHKGAKIAGPVLNVTYGVLLVASLWIGP